MKNTIWIKLALKTMILMSPLSHIPLLFSDDRPISALYNKVQSSITCETQSPDELEAKLVCDAELDNLRFQILHDSTLPHFSSAHVTSMVEGRYLLRYGGVHTCVIVVDSQDIEYVFIPPKSLKIYRDWPTCFKEDSAVIDSAFNE